MNNLLVKLDRLSAWILFVSLMVYFVSGYGMTKGIISYDFAAKLHLSYLTYIVLISFVAHTAFAIHLAFRRWQIWNGVGKSVLVFFYLFFISFFVYVDYFYQPNNKVPDTNSKPKNESLPSSSSDSKQSVNSETIAPTPSKSAKTFTSEELAKYNGENGNSAYVAVDGDVYDLTSVFKEGKHFSHYAGQELTNSFYSYHVKRELSKYPIVGKMI